MTITLSDGTVTLQLPPTLYWADEYAWSAVVQSSGYTLTGSLVVEQATRQAGRPITLTTPYGGAWMPRTDLETLRAWRDQVGTLTLTLHDGQARTVVWRHADGPLSAEPVEDGLPDPGADSLYRVTLRFLET